MPSIITCPRCGKMESWSPGKGARTHCRFCQAPLTGSAVVSTPAASPAKREKTSPLLKATLTGGGAGAAISAALTLVFNAVPVLILALAFAGHQALNDQQKLQLAQAALGELVTFLVAAAAGFAVGAVLMA